MKNTRGERITGYAYRASAVVYPVVLALTAEYAAGGSPAAALNLMARAFPSFAASVFAVALLYFCILLLVRRAWLAAALVSLPLLSVAGVNYYRMRYTGEPLAAGDIAFVAYLPELMRFTGGVAFSAHLAVCAGVCAGCVCVMFVLRRPVSLPMFIRCGAPLVLLGAFMVNGALLTLFYKEQPAPSDGYRSNGFIAHFMYESLGLRVGTVDARELSELEQDLINAGARAAAPVPADGGLNIGEPHGEPYGEPRGDARFAGDYIPAPIDDGSEEIAEEPEDVYTAPDIIFILSESFWDIKLLPGVRFSDDPTKNYDLLAASGWSGSLLSPTVVGRTDRVEFEVLTGATVDVLAASSTIPFHIIEENTFSVASYLKGLGYYTVGLHTYGSEFYSRDIAYPKMGFDVYKGLDDIPYEYTLNSLYVPDAVLGEWIRDTLEQAQSPCFIMAVTMENHGPFAYRNPAGGITVSFEPDYGFDDYFTRSLRTLAATVGNNDAMLGELAAYLAARERPAVLLFFGDHLPFLGDNYQGFVDSGYIGSGDASEWTASDYVKMFSTPFVIWHSKNSEYRDAGRVAAYHMAGMALEAAGLPLNNFYTLINEYREILPAYRRYVRVDGNGRLGYFGLDETQQQYRDWHVAYSRSVLGKYAR